MATQLSHFSSAAWVRSAGLLVLGLAGCGTADDPPEQEPVGSGGGTSAGGSPTSGVGGQSSSGAGGQTGTENGVGGSPGGGAGSGGGGVSSSGGETSAGGSDGEPAIVECPATYQNPILWEDLPDVEVIRVGDVFYYTASTFHHSPGAPVLKSYDLVNWRYEGHSVPALDFTPAYDLDGGRAYVDGIWASTLQYRESNSTFYWMGCMHDGGGGYAFTAPSPTGPWEKHKTGGCYYDMGLLVDDDDTMYVAYGNDTIHVAELSADGFSQVRTQQVYQTPDSVGGPLEGSRFKKINGKYYIFLTQYANGEYVLRADDPFGPYEMRPFAVKLPYSGLAGSGSAPHQGGLIDTPNGDWYYMAFNDSFPSGRIPVMAPVTWADGWPTVTLVDGRWGGTYPFPDVTCRATESTIAVDTFSGATIGAQWEWNHSPDDSKWELDQGLVLQTATVTNDLYAARNTLTRRIRGPISTATLKLDFSQMQVGDVAGLAVFRDATGWIGIKRADGGDRVVATSGVNLAAGNWNTTALGTEMDSEAITGTTLWLRAEANVRSDAGGATARFSYSTDGTQFQSLGSAITLNKDWQYFLGYRFAIFNYATAALGGSITASSFEIVTP